MASRVGEARTSSLDARKRGRMEEQLAARRVHERLETSALLTARPTAQNTHTTRETPRAGAGVTTARAGSTPSSTIPTSNRSSSSSNRPRLRLLRRCTATRLLSTWAPTWIASPSLRRSALAPSLVHIHRVCRPTISISNNHSSQLQPRRTRCGLKAGRRKPTPRRAGKGQISGEASPNCGRRLSTLPRRSTGSSSSRNRMDRCPLRASSVRPPRSGPVGPLPASHPCRLVVRRLFLL
jgi:hypothetical protein